MGRKLLEIRRFHQGMAARGDGRDLDPDAASLALDTDPDAPQGLLRGRRGPSPVLTHAEAPDRFDRMKVIQRRDGQNDLVGLQAADGRLLVVQDYPGDIPYYKDLGTVEVGEATTVNVINNQAYLGLGDAPPRWVGHIESPQLGQTPPAGYQMEAAEVAPPQSLEFDSSQNIRPAGALTDEIIVDSGDPTACPESGLILVPFRTSEGHLDTITVAYGFRNADRFYGLTWLGENKELIPDEYTIGDDASHSVVTYSEVNLMSEPAYRTSDRPDDFNIAFYFSKQGSDGWLSGQTYVLGASYVYDGYKESPLTIITQGGLYAGGTVPTTEEAEDYGRLYMKLFLQGHSGNNPTLSRRVTAVRLYVAPFNSRSDTRTRTGDVNPPAQQGSFRLAEHIDLRDVDASNGDHHRAEVRKGGYTGSTYTDSSGQIEALGSSVLHYGVSAQLNNELFVGQVTNPSVPDEDWSNYVCKSEPLRFESFDWANNYVVLPRPVTALAAFAGRIYAFDEFTMYRINPQRMYIEDTFDGIGALNGDCVATSEHGLFVASRQNIYLFDGKQISRISEPIAEIAAVDGYDTYGYRRFVQQELSAYGPEHIRLGFDAEQSCLLVYADSGTARRLWLFHAGRGVWMAGAPAQWPAWCRSHRGSLLASGPADKTLHEVARGARLGWTWITQKLSMQRDSQLKKFRKATPAGDAVSVSYRIDGGAWADISTLDTASASSKGRWIQLKLEGTSAEEVKALSILYRDKGGYPA